MSLDFDKNIYVLCCGWCKETEMIKRMPINPINCIGCCRRLALYDNLITYNKDDIKKGLCKCKVCNTTIIPKLTISGKMVNQCNCFGLYYGDDIQANDILSLA